MELWADGWMDEREVGEWRWEGLRLKVEVGAHPDALGGVHPVLYWNR